MTAKHNPNAVITRMGPIASSSASWARRIAPAMSVALESGMFDLAVAMRCAGSYGIQLRNLKFHADHCVPEVLRRGSRAVANSDVMSTTWRARFGAAWPWLLLGFWAALQLAIAWKVQTQEQGPIDFLTYQIAAEKIAHGTSPYATASANLAIWRAYHRLDSRRPPLFAPCPPSHSLDFRRDERRRRPAETPKTVRFQ